MKTLHPAPGVIETHLRSLPLFAGLPSGDVARVAEGALLRLYEREEDLFREGDEARDLFCLVQGVARALRTGPGGKEKVLHLATAPGLVGEVPTMAGRPFPATARCTEECTVMVVPRRALLDLARRDPEILLRVLASSLMRLKELAGLLAEHGERSALVRVASYLLGHLQQGAVDLPAPKKDVANLLGLTPETFSRALAVLRDDGAIEVDESTVHVLRREEIERLLEAGD